MEEQGAEQTREEVLQVARSLAAELRSKPIWLQSIGIGATADGSPRLVVYVEKLPRNGYASRHLHGTTYQGYPVEVVRIGRLEIRSPRRGE